MRVLVLTLPGVIATDDALLTFQERVEAAPDETIVGEAVKEEMVGLLVATAFTAMIA
jgi:hypothetical protein